MRNRLPGPKDMEPAQLVFTADGKRAIVSYRSKYLEKKPPDSIGVCVWDVTSGRELLRIPGTAGALALSPDEKTLAAADYNTIHLWELASGKERARFTGHRHNILTLAFSPDGRFGNRQAKGTHIGKQSGPTRVQGYT
jgi:WD40 repeat protein